MSIGLLQLTTRYVKHSPSMSPCQATLQLIIKCTSFMDEKNILSCLMDSRFSAKSTRTLIGRVPIVCLLALPD